MTCMSSSLSLLSLVGHTLQVRHKQDWDRGFTLLLPQAAVLPRSDIDGDVVKPTLSFVIQNCQISYYQKHGAWKNFHSTPHFIYNLSTQKRGCQVWQGCPKDCAQLAQMGV